MTLSLGLIMAWVKSRALALDAPVVGYAVIAALVALSIWGVTSATQSVYQTIVASRDAEWQASTSAALEQSRRESEALAEKARDAAEKARALEESTVAARERISQLEEALGLAKDDPVVFSHDVVKRLRRQLPSKKGTP